VTVMPVGATVGGVELRSAPRNRESVAEIGRAGAGIGAGG